MINGWRRHHGKQAKGAGRRRARGPRPTAEGCSAAGRRALPWRQLQGAAAPPQVPSRAVREGGRERQVQLRVRGAGHGPASPGGAAGFSPPAAAGLAKDRKGVLRPATRTKKRGGESDALKPAPQSHPRPAAQSNTTTRAERLRR